MSFTPRHISVSSIGLFTRCPAQWKRRYVDRLVPPATAAQATGIAFHKALEAQHRGQDGELVWLAAADGVNDALTATNQTLTMSKEHGLKLLKLYRERGLHDVIGEPERMFKLTLPTPNIPVPVLGYIDLTVPSERHFRDFKTTGGNYWNETKVALEPQVAVYGWAYQQIYHHRAERALWCIFSTNTVTLDVYEVVPSPDAFRLFEQTAEMVWQAILAEQFEGCGTCPEVCKPPVQKLTTGPVLVWEAAS